MPSDANDSGPDGPGTPRFEVTPPEDARDGRPEPSDLGAGPDRVAHRDRGQDRLPGPTEAVASGGDVQGGTPPPDASDAEDAGG